MLKSLRAALAPAGGLSTLVALGAIAWGLGRLQSLADERQAHLDHLESAAATVTERLEEALAQLAGLDLDDAPEPFPFRRDYSENGHASWCTNATTDHTFCVRPGAEDITEGTEPE